MQLSEITQLHYPFHSNLTQFHSFDQLNTMPNPFDQLQTTFPQFQNLNPNSTNFGSNSTSDEADLQHISFIINERKQRRIISNRESARRSRVRKQNQLHELRSQIVWLRNENQQIVEKLNRLLENRDRILQENARIRGEISDLRRVIDEMQMVNDSYAAADMREVDDLTEKLNK